MNQHLSLKGVYTALATPFNAQGKIDFDALARIIEDQKQARVAGVVALGTTGEAPTISPQERNELIQAVVTLVAGEFPVIVGTSTNCTETTIAHTREAAELGADVALVSTPYYNKPGQSGIKAHFNAVADHGGLPILMYNVPGRTAVQMSPQTITSLAQHEQIIGIKESSGCVDFLQDVLAALRESEQSIAVLSGDDSLALPFISLGATGVVSVLSNVAGEMLVNLVSAALEGNAAHANELQHQLLPLMRALFSETNPQPIKAAMELRGLCESSCRLPLVSAEQHTKVKLSELLSALGLS